MIADGYPRIGGYPSAIICSSAVVPDLRGNTRRRAWDPRRWDETTAGTTEHSCPNSEMSGSLRGGWGGLADYGYQVAFLDYVAFGDVHLGDRAGVFGEHRDLHLHGFQDHQGVTFFDLIAFGRDDLPHVRDHLRADLCHGLSLDPSAAGPAPSANLRTQLAYQGSIV